MARELEVCWLLLTWLWSCLLHLLQPLPSHSKIEQLPNKTSIMPQPQSRVGGYIDSMFCREYHTSYHVALAPGRRTEKFHDQLLVDGGIQNSASRAMISLEGCLWPSTRLPGQRWLVPSGKTRGPGPQGPKLGSTCMARSGDPWDELYVRYSGDTERWTYVIGPRPTLSHCQRHLFRAPVKLGQK
jgi:hypothetical protein